MAAKPSSSFFTWSHFRLGGILIIESYLSLRLILVNSTRPASMGSVSSPAEIMRRQSSYVWSVTGTPRVLEAGQTGGSDNGDATEETEEPAEPEEPNNQTPHSPPIQRGQRCVLRAVGANTYELKPCQVHDTVSWKTRGHEHNR
ncbi:hypothetical protein EYF80_053650 [Liparis tanakae]|uniref:Uncharacterized protein n=1 Tax=Liparis tanakae TaxID=230148 RepID=A0A4Z2F4Z8_9TELE|nr:hypothetical protein EYF80_053650 [Liparis tanakae]